MNLKYLLKIFIIIFLILSIIIFINSVIMSLQNQNEQSKELIKDITIEGMNLHLDNKLQHLDNNIQHVDNNLQHVVKNLKLDNYLQPQTHPATILPILTPSTLDFEKISHMNPLITDSSKAFCDTNKGFNSETSCNALTKYNCGLTSCCIWTSDKKCKAGNQNGPLFGSDSNGKTIPLDYYYFKNNCYGENCPKNSVV